MWPFSKIKELECRIQKLEGKDYTPKMLTAFGERYISGSWLTEDSCERYMVSHSTVIRAILNHLGLELNKSIGKPPEVTLEKKLEPLAFYIGRPTQEPTKKKRK